MAGHTHVYRPISVSLDPHWPMALFTCVKGTCIDTESLCVLCIEDGNRRAHKRKHSPVTDRQLFNKSVLLLTKAVMEMEKHYGPTKGGPKDE